MGSHSLDANSQTARNRGRARGGGEVKRIEFDQECDKCNGTGLYVGMAEHDGAAVVCYHCGGTGKYHFVHDYKEFIERKENNSVKRVYQANPGIVIGERRGVCKLEDFGGLAIEDWKIGILFTAGTEDRNHICPCWFYQSADRKKKPEWEECRESLGATFSHCPRFAKKEKCWERFDTEAHA